MNQTMTFEKIQKMMDNPQFCVYETQYRNRFGNPSKHRFISKSDSITEDTIKNDNIDYIHCLIADDTYTKILLIKTFKPSLNDDIIQIPKIKVASDDYKIDAETWLKEKLGIKTVSEQVNRTNIFINPETSNETITILNMVKIEDIPDEILLKGDDVIEPIWIDFKDIPSIIDDSNIKIDVFTYLVLTYYYET